MKRNTSRKPNQEEIDQGIIGDEPMVPFFSAKRKPAQSQRLERGIRSNSCFLKFSSRILFSVFFGIWSSG